MSRRLAVLWWRRMAQHLRLPGQNQERLRASRNVLCVQISRRLPMQGTPQTEKETDGKLTLEKLIEFCLSFFPSSLQGVSSKNTPNEVEIIRYQVLIPVTEVQVRASSAKDMDSHFLWELIHLRSQLQRRSEKVYVLSNSTSDFRNAFLKTIRQIIRESVRNMSIPMKERGSMSSVSSIGQPHYQGNSQTLERPLKQSCTMFTQGSHTLGKPKKKTTQRLSAGNIDYDNLPSSHDTHDYQDEPPPPAFRIRSKTVGDEPPPVPKRTTSELSTEKDPGVKSEGEDESLMGHRSKSLGRTPNHLTLR